MQPLAKVLRIKLIFIFLSNDRAENEGKLLLWFGKILELTLRQLHYGGAPSMIGQTLQTFVSTLSGLGEDKSHAGLLGAIGLGRKSQLSLR